MLRHPIRPPGGATQPAPGEKSCPCLCFCVRMLGGASVLTPHGDYFVPPEGERIYGPVAHPADITGRDLGVPLPTSPPDQWSHELLVRNAQAEVMASTTALEAARPAVILDATIPEGWRREASTVAPAPATPIAVDLPPAGPTRTPEATAATSEGDASLRIASLPPSPGAVPSSALDELLAEGAIDLEGLGPWIRAKGPATLLSLPPLVALGTPEEPAPPAPSPGPGPGPGPQPGSGVPGNGEDEAGGGGGRAQAPIRDLPSPRPPVLAPGTSLTPKARAPRSRPLAPDDQAPAFLQPPLHTGAPPGGPRPLTPGHMVATRHVPPASSAHKPGPGQSQAPRPLRVPDAAGRPRLRPGDGALPIQAPPDTAATAPPPSSTPPTVAPPATAAPALPPGNAKESAVVRLGRELRAGSTATPLVEPGPVGGPVKPVSPRPPLGPGQLPPRLAVRRIAHAETATPRSFPAGQTVLSPTGVDRSIEGGMPQRNGGFPAPDRARLEAPRDGAIPPPPSPAPRIDLATPPNTLSDDTLATYTMPRPSGPTIVPAATLPTVGAPPGTTVTRPYADLAPPAVLGGGTGSPSRRGRPSGKTAAYGQAVATRSRAGDEARRLREEAAGPRAEADAARQELAQTRAKLKEAKEKWAKAGGGAKANPHGAEVAEASHAMVDVESRAWKAEAKAAPLEARAAALEAQAKEAGARATELLEDVRRENPQTGLELAQAAADRALEAAKRLEAKIPTRHEIRQSVRDRARDVFREGQLDRKRQRKLAPDEYRTWRQGQDRTEARVDAPVRRELEERKATSDRATKEIEGLQKKAELGAEEKARLAELKTIERSSRLSRQGAQVLRRLKDRHLDRGDREKARQARDRAKQRTAQGAEDTKQRKRLSPAAYETWRAEQDQKEAAEDRTTHDALTRREKEYEAVQNRALALEKEKPLNSKQAQELEALQDRARELALTEEEAQELTQAIPERQEKRKERADKRAEPSKAATVGPVGRAGPSPAPPSKGAGLVAADALATDGTPAPAAPCARCSCVPPCPADQRCVCFEVPGTAPTEPRPPRRSDPAGGAAENGGKSPIIPEGVSLNPLHGQAEPTGPGGNGEPEVPTVVSPAHGAEEPETVTRPAPTKTTERPCPCEPANDLLVRIERLSADLWGLEARVDDMRHSIDRTGRNGCFGRLGPGSNPHARVESAYGSLRRIIAKFLRLQRPRLKTIHGWVTGAVCHKCHARILEYLHHEVELLELWGEAAAGYAGAAFLVLGQQFGPDLCAKQLDLYAEARALLESAIRRLEAREVLPTLYLHHPDRLLDATEEWNEDVDLLIEALAGILEQRRFFSRGWTIEDPNASNGPPLPIDWFLAGADLVAAFGGSPKATTRSTSARRAGRPRRRSGGQWSFRRRAERRRRGLRNPREIARAIESLRTRRLSRRAGVELTGNRSRGGEAPSKRSPFRKRYLSGSGGRWGGRSTRELNDRIATQMERDLPGCCVRGDARTSEEWIPGPGGGKRGGTFVDITVRTQDGRTVRIQTVDTLADGVTPTPREAAAAARIRAQFPGDELRLVPKPK